MKKIFITGGHLTPAVAVIDEIQDRKLVWEIIFIGRRYAVEGSHEMAHEEEIIRGRGVRFIELRTGRLQRSFTFYTISSLIKIPYGFVQALILCMREKPDAVVSFGGYVALPVVVASYILRIPILTHEQTRVVGIANKIIAFLAKKICISFPDIRHTFPQQKTIYTGLPVRKELLNAHPAGPFKGDIHHPSIYITGGTTGSVSINNLLFPLIPYLAQRFTIIHQTGRISFAKAKEEQSRLRELDRKRYIIQDYFDEHIVASILHVCVLVICRSGANTVYELALLKKNAILIPLPWSGGNEQFENAQWLSLLGLGTIIEQRTFSPERFKHLIEEVLHHKVTHQASDITIRADGAARVVDEIGKILQ